MPEVICQKCGAAFADLGIGKWTCSQCGHAFEISPSPVIQVRKGLPDTPVAKRSWKAEKQSGCAIRFVAGLAIVGGTLGFIGTLGNPTCIVIVLLGFLIESVWAIVDELQNR